MFASVLVVRIHAVPHCAGEASVVEAAGAAAALSEAQSPWRAGDAATMAVAVAAAVALLTASLHAGGASAAAAAVAVTVVVVRVEVAATAVAQAAAPRDVSADAWCAIVGASVMRVVVVTTTPGVT